MTPVDTEWERWLGERFPGYLLRDAAGGARSPEHVRNALSRLTGQPGALTRLAELNFLLDTELGTRELIEELVPQLLRRVYPHTTRVVDERRGSARGRIDWPKTIGLRTRTRDRSWFVGVSPKRTFETADLLLVRFLLDRVLRIVADVGRAKLEVQSGWMADVARLHAAAQKSRAHAAMRDLPVQWPSAHQRAQCALSRDPVVRAALRVLAQHDRLLPQPAPDALEATVSRFALAPLDVHKRFELFVLLSVMERLDHALPQCPREDALIAAGRSEVARWELPTGMLSLHYDQSPAAGTHADTVAHYFGASASVRPDVRLRWSSSADHRELYLDAKHSLELSYLSHSHLKMHGYIADAPERFVEPGPKVVLVCPRTVVGKPRAGDAVCYVSDADCAAGGVLEAVLKVWLERVGETSRPSCGHQTWQGV